jgi:hypothetical protein
MRWPDNTPAEVQALANQLIGILNQYDADVAGPAIGIAFGFTICELGGCADDVRAVDRMMQDVRALVLKYGAAVVQSQH